MFSRFVGLWCGPFGVGGDYVVVEVVFKVPARYTG